MLDFGWTELLLISAVAVFVIGPDEIPKVLYSLGKMFRKISHIKADLLSNMDDVMAQVEIDEYIKKNNDYVMDNKGGSRDEDIDGVKPLIKSKKEIPVSKDIDDD